MTDDPCPWLPPDFEPLEMLADGTRLTRETVGANDAGRETLIPRIQAAIGRVGNATSIVEVGSWAGAHALKLAHFLGPKIGVRCVDTWAGTDLSRSDTTSAIAKALSPETVYSVFRRNTRLARNIQCVRTDSLTAVKWFVKASEACVFIDADHSYEAVRNDLRAWWPIVAKGGLVCGHDYHMFPGVKRAVDEWAKENGHTVIVEGECWFVEKPL